ncbi:MAG: twin-arginine translocation signal domain-containing protein [Hyphomicrobiales bacterium]|nr:twin-arginine translocation signal domain-containing protein [Hyphomicrobiales bacterium]
MTSKFWEPSRRSVLKACSSGCAVALAAGSRLCCFALA